MTLYRLLFKVEDLVALEIEAESLEAAEEQAEKYQTLWDFPLSAGTENLSVELDDVVDVKALREERARERAALVALSRTKP